MRRFIRYDHLGAPIGEISENDIISLVKREEINGEHSLAITTFQALNKYERILYEDGRGYWHEYVVAGVDAEHASGKRVVGSYYCVWSLQADLEAVLVSAMPGTQGGTTAGLALQAALSTQSRWAVGTVTNMTVSGASMYDMTAWKALGVLVANWGGELSTTISVSSTGIVSRLVDYYDKQGNQTVLRRFDFGADLMSIKRTFSDAPFFCRISPRGKGAQTDGGGYGRKIRINDDDPTQPDWIEYAPMVDVAKLPDGASGYIYPTLIVENSDCETPADLLAWGNSVVEGYCTPKVTYEMDVIQAAAEGVDASGVSLGDAVDVVDRYFDDGLRVSGRVIAQTVDELNERNITLTIGQATDTLAGKFADAEAAYVAATNLQEYLATAAYIDDLLWRINAEINATGGYTYITQGQGLRTYDTAVSDPLVGSEASQVVEIKGGNIRIANTKTAQGEWEWRTVIQSGLLVADVVLAAAITSGYIGNQSGNYWNLDTGQLTIANSAIEANIGSTGTVNSDVMWKRFAITTSYSTAETNGFQIASKKSSGGWIGLFPAMTDDLTSGGYHWGSIIGSGRLVIAAYGNETNAYGYLKLNTTSASLGFGALSTAAGQLMVSSSGTSCGALSATSVTASDTVQGQSVTATNSRHIATLTGDGYVYLGPASPGSGRYVNIRSNAGCSMNLDVTGGLTVSGTKRRLVETQNYSDRLLYAYETPAPYFGDIGSGTIGDDGLCYVEIDDIFAETVRTDYAYQVFLQACGRGDLWVSEKTPTHFVVAGTPGLSFDWEVKCRQRDYETTRLECKSLDDGIEAETDYVANIEGMYADEYGWIDELERMLNGEYQAA